MDEPKVGSGVLALLASAGFGALVAGVFSVGSDLIKQPASELDRQCTVAAQVLLDEAPNPYIGNADRIRIGRLAALRVERCMNGKRR